MGMPYLFTTVFMMDKKDAPLVSVLMTAYNRQNFIAEAIDSVLASTFTDFELIIVDDGSSDDTVRIAREFERKDRRVKVFENGQNLGDYPNRNQAAAYATGKYLKYVDSDDTIFPDGLRYCVLSMAENPSAEWGIIYPAKIPRQTLMSPAESIPYHFFTFPFLHCGPGGTILKRDFFFRAGRFPVLYGPANDMYFNLQAAAKGNVLLLQDIFYGYRVHPMQEQTNQFSYLYNYSKYLKDALENLELPLTSKQINWLQLKRQRRFAVNISRYFLKTWNIGKTRMAIEKADFSWRDYFTGIFHLAAKPSAGNQ